MRDGNRGRASSFRSAAQPHRDSTVELPAGPELLDGWMTQFGKMGDRFPFREHPRFETEFDVSVLRGRLTLEQTVRAIFGRPPKPGHCARHLDVCKLVAATYRCLDTGNLRNPQHASILASCTEEDIEAHRAWWEDPRRVTLQNLAESEVIGNAV
ncbi:hypothetical protein PP484_gp70 [Gordonia phage Madeline]|uniref:Uncharacterized protein n=1 Tax=Gordonia phage Madeline TaxID=2591189 RepID=A0A514A2Z2_9CAUD|nr:hypothetical protein PP484_gp70 [Gordonia phage Madeline]QDH47643.1 hypothetical protein SEA_MADELINE_40 [Gordonia phage Madeline]